MTFFEAIRQHMQELVWNKLLFFHRILISDSTFHEPVWDFC